MWETHKKFAGYPSSWSQLQTSPGETYCPPEIEAIKTASGDFYGLCSASIVTGVSSPIPEIKTTLKKHDISGFKVLLSPSLSPPKVHARSFVLNTTKEKDACIAGVLHLLANRH